MESVFQMSPTVSFSLDQTANLEAAQRKNQEHSRKLRERVLRIGIGSQLLAAECRREQEKNQ